MDLSIQEAFSLPIPSGSGPAFDSKCKVDGIIRVSRVAFIASPVGVLEFNSLSSPEESETAKLNLRFLSRGFRISDANAQFGIPLPVRVLNAVRRSHPGPGGMESANLSSDARSFSGRVPDENDSGRG